MSPISRNNGSTNRLTSILSINKVDNQNNHRVIVKKIVPESVQQTDAKLQWLTNCSTQETIIFTHNSLQAIDNILPPAKSQICYREDFSKTSKTTNDNREEGTVFIERVLSYANGNLSEKQAKNNCPLSPESKKKDELCSYLKLMDSKRKVHKSIINVNQHRRSKRVQKLQKELDKDKPTEDATTMENKKEEAEDSNPPFFNVHLIPKSFFNEVDFEDCIKDIVKELRPEKTKKTVVKANVSKSPGGSSSSKSSKPASKSKLRTYARPKNPRRTRAAVKEKLKKSAMAKAKFKLILRSKRFLRSANLRLHNNLLSEPLNKKTMPSHRRKIRLLQRNKRKREDEEKEDESETNSVDDKSETNSVEDKIETISICSDDDDDPTEISKEEEETTVVSVANKLAALHEHNYTKRLPTESVDDDVLRSMNILNERIGHLIKNKIKFPIVQDENEKLPSNQQNKVVSESKEIPDNEEQEEVKEVESKPEEKIAPETARKEHVNIEVEIIELIDDDDDEEEAVVMVEEPKVVQQPEITDKNENSLTFTPKNNGACLNHQVSDIEMEIQRYEIPVSVPREKTPRNSLRSSLVQTKRRKTASYDSAGRNVPDIHSLGLSDDNGEIVNAYYYDYNLVITQSKLIGFWMQSPLGFVLEAQNMWIPKGTIPRLNMSGGCVMRHSAESFISTDSSVAYVELWTKEHKSDYRERPATDIFIVVYFCKNHRDPPEKKLLQVENISGYADDVKYVVLRTTGHIIVSWTLHNKDTTDSVIRCYHLAQDFQTIISVKEIESVQYTIDSLHNIQDCDKLFLGYGAGKITIWNLEYGYQVATLELTPTQPEPSLLWVKCDRGFLFALQAHYDGFLSLLAINGLNHSWKRLQLYKPPENYHQLQGVCLEDGILISFYSNGILCWDVKNGKLLAADHRANENYFTSGKHVIVTSDKLVTVRTALSFLLTNYDLNDVEASN